MTAYQEIERELRSLGWVPTQGKGDHMKFQNENDKSRGQIVVSMSVNHNNRAYKNMLSDIRKVEPRFTFGRPTPKKADDKKADGVPAIPANCPPYLIPGSSVRYTGPEGRDWKKLDDPGSLMNHEYIVTEFLGDSVKIHLTERDDIEKFAVPVGDVDAWTLVKCSDCGRSLPANVFTNQFGVPYGNGQPVCEDCAKESERIKSKLRKQELADIPDVVNNHMIKEMRDSMTKQFLKNIKKIPEAIMPDEVKQAKSLLNDNVTPFHCWQRSIARILKNISDENKILPNTKEYRKLQSLLRDANYSIRKKNGINIIQVTTNNWDTTLYIWERLVFVDAEFIKLYTERNFIVQLINKSENFNQYISTLQYSQEKINELTAILDEPENLFQRMRKDAECSQLHVAIDECFKVVKEVFGKDDLTLKEIDLECYKEIDPGYENDEFETAPSHNVIIMYIDDIDETNKAIYERLTQRKEEMCQGQPKTVKIFPLIRDFSKEEENKGCFSSVVSKPKEKKEIQKENIVYGNKPGQTLMMVNVVSDKDVIIHAYQPENDEEKDKCVKMLDETFSTILNDDNSAISQALKKTITAYNEKHKKDMNYLDLTNPDSENKATGCITTRELLKELKSRGLSFGKVEITVKQEVDLDSI